MADLGDPIRVIEVQPPVSPVPEIAPAEAPELEPEYVDDPAEVGS